jgi:hypothetical protein
MELIWQSRMPMTAKEEILWYGKQGGGLAGSVVITSAACFGPARSALFNFMVA